MLTLLVEVHRFFLFGTFTTRMDIRLRRRHYNFNGRLLAVIVFIDGPILKVGFKVELRAELVNIIRDVMDLR